MSVANETDEISGTEIMIAGDRDVPGPSDDSTDTGFPIDRENLKAALADSESPKLQKFLAALAGTRYRGWNIGTVARKFSITPNELTTIWRDHNLAKGMATIIAGIPEIAADVVEDARSIKVICPQCDGWRFVPVPEHLQEKFSARVVECPNCDGTGMVRKPGSDVDRQRMWEAAGLARKGNGVGVQVNVNAGQFQGVESVIEELERTTRHQNSIDV
jgi:hypothetical protein